MEASVQDERVRKAARQYIRSIVTGGLSGPIVAREDSICCARTIRDVKQVYASEASYLYLHREDHHAV